MEKEAEAPARMAVVVRPTVWRTRAELGVRAAIVCIVRDLVVCVCWLVIYETRAGLLYFMRRGGGGGMGRRWAWCYGMTCGPSSRGFGLKKLLGVSTVGATSGVVLNGAGR